MDTKKQTGKGNSNKFTSGVNLSESECKKGNELPRGRAIGVSTGRKIVKNTSGMITHPTPSQVERLRNPDHSGRGIKVIFGYLSLFFILTQKIGELNHLKIKDAEKVLFLLFRNQWPTLRLGSKREFKQACVVF